MKVIANIKEGNTGRGGHYYSFLEIRNALRALDGVEVLSVSIGDEVPVPYRNDDAHKHYYCTLDSIGDVVASLCLECHAHNVSFLHAYDDVSAYVVSRVCQLINLRYLVTKCGGPAAKWYYPTHPNMVVFHQDDFSRYKKQNKHENNVWLLPGRVAAYSPQSIERERLSPSALHQDAFKVVRIGRIGETYKKAIMQAIFLVKELNKAGFRSTLSVIGYVESSEVLGELHQVADDSVSFHTDEQTTRNASDHLRDFDAVVATGRGAQEAFSASKVVFAPILDDEHPQLVDELNFDYFMASNFSLRVRKNDLSSKYLDLDELIDEVRTLDRERYFRWQSYVFQSLFSVGKTANSLREIYKLNLPGPTIFIKIHCLLWFKIYRMAKRIRGSNFHLTQL